MRPSISAKINFDILKKSSFGFGFVAGNYQLVLPENGKKNDLDLFINLHLNQKCQKTSKIYDVNVS